ncbi:MAG TPA: class I SAM-dependent methyltransferase [bacterium]|nr:class I SAM-dependent methyltransferase [bacterium]
MLKCPETGGPVVFRDGAFESVESPGVRFPVEDGIIRAFLPDGGDLKGDVTDVIKAFYEETPFPSYDEMETPGSLIEKSLDRVFPDMLNRSIPPHTKVLEVGCGTGQLGNFLSIADRKVLSVDMCLNSLRQAQNFKEKNGFDNVSFAQMNLFRMPLQAEYFDVVICTGVLHHTGFPEKGFRGLVPLVRPGGHIIIGLYNLYGRLKTRARRVLFGLIGERYASLDPYISRFGATGEKLHSWFMDQYKNPHESYHTMDEVLRWFRENGIIFLRGLPGTVFGSGFEMDYRASLFEPEPPGTGMDRFLSQVNQMLTDTEGGLFIMIGRKE